MIPELCAAKVQGSGLALKVWKIQVYVSKNSIPTTSHLLFKAQSNIQKVQSQLPVPVSELGTFLERFLLQLCHHGASQNQKSVTELASSQDIPSSVYLKNKSKRTDI